MIPREVLEKVRLIEIRARHQVEDVFSGQYESVFKGRGMEFEEVREYVPGDDVRNIDWNVTARTGQLFVKKHREERELTVMLVVDVSGSLQFGSGQKLKSEVAAELCAILAFSAIRNNDRVGLLTFSDRVLNFIPPKKGRRHGMRVIREILYPRKDSSDTEVTEPRTEGEGRMSKFRQLPSALSGLLGLRRPRRSELQTDIGGSLRFLNTVLRRRCIAFLVSDFVSSGEFIWDLMLTAKRHDLTACIVSDEREEQLVPVGLVALEDPETGQTAVIDTNQRSFRRDFALAREREREELSRRLMASSVESVRIPASGDYLSSLVALFQRRKRRLAAGR